MAQDRFGNVTDSLAKKLAASQSGYGAAEAKARDAMLAYCIAAVDAAQSLEEARAALRAMLEE